MRYFSISTLGNNQDRDLVLIDRLPKGMGLKSHCVVFGERIGENYPSDAQIQLSLERPGIKLSSLLGNLESCFIVCTAMKDEILNCCDLHSIEALPFTLYNHKGRVHSTDYWIINPIGYFDCVNRRASSIRYLSTDPSKIVSVKKMVFDLESLKKAPHLFRVVEDRVKYFISEELANAFKQKNFTNVILKEIEQQPS